MYFMSNYQFSGIYLVYFLLFSLIYLNIVIKLISYLSKKISNKMNIVEIDISISLIIVTTILTFIILLSSLSYYENNFNEKMLKNSILINNINFEEFNFKDENYYKLTIDYEIKELLNNWILEIKETELITANNQKINNEIFGENINDKKRNYYKEFFEDYKENIVIKEKGEGRVVYLFLEKEVEKNDLLKFKTRLFEVIIDVNKKEIVGYKIKKENAKINIKDR